MPDTAPSLCAIVAKWLGDYGYTRLHVRHGQERCAISTTDMAENWMDLGYINAHEVIFVNNIDEYDPTCSSISAYDPKFFELLAERLSFVKP